MLAFKSFLTIGIAALAVVEAQGRLDKAEGERTLSEDSVQVSTITPSLIFSPVIPKDKPLGQRAYPPRIPDSAKVYLDFSPIKDKTTRAESLEQVYPVEDFRPTDDEANPIQGRQEHRIRNDCIERANPFECITHRDIDTFPDGPGGYKPNGPPDATSGDANIDTTDSRSPLVNEPVPFPNGPAPPAKRDATWTVKCSGSNLESKIRTCSKGDEDTNLTGAWCAANCKCDKNGCMKCESKKAPGCSGDVLTATCKAVVRDWSCLCRREVDGRESHC